MCWIFCGGIDCESAEWRQPMMSAQIRAMATAAAGRVRSTTWMRRAATPRAISRFPMPCDPAITPRQPRFSRHDERISESAAIGSGHRNNTGVPVRCSGRQAARLEESNARITSIAAPFKLAYLARCAQRPARAQRNRKCRARCVDQQCAARCTRNRDAVSGIRERAGQPAQGHVRRGIRRGIEQQQIHARGSRGRPDGRRDNGVGVMAGSVRDCACPVRVAADLPMMRS